ncbi:MAG: ABC transporter permease [Planctomycetota bacterium]|nr:ABC transporter permease [Planctomycetota bacterium]
MSAFAETLQRSTYRSQWFRIFKRELRGYFTTPVAYVFLVIYLLVQAGFTWGIGRLYEQSNATLYPFFNYHPWFLLFLMPGLGMRLWAEERRSGTIELLLTLPIRAGSAVCGKFLAAWTFFGIALLLTMGEWYTVAWLGGPDHGVILVGYLGTFLMAGAYLAISSCASALSKNQVIGLVLGVVVCFSFMLADIPMMVSAVDALGVDALTEAFLQMSFRTHYDNLLRGVIEARDLVFFGTLIGAALYINTALVQLKKAS